jgi:GNAT superfamily N-acetyltransferase
MAENEVKAASLAAWARKDRMKLLKAKPEDVPSALKRQLPALMRDAFIDGQGPYDYGPETPSLLVLSVWGQTVVGHLAAYVREALVGHRPLKLGLIGGVVVDGQFRRRGYAKAMILEAHDFFRLQSIEFSVLFATEPDTYRSSGYREMQNKTHFLDRDGGWKEYVYRGGMVAELAGRPWTDQYLDLCGPTV